MSAGSTCASNCQRTAEANPLFQGAQQLLARLVAHHEMPRIEVTADVGVSQIWDEEELSLRRSPRAYAGGTRELNTRTRQPSHMHTHTHTHTHKTSLPPPPLSHAHAAAPLRCKWREGCAALSGERKAVVTRVRWQSRGSGLVPLHFFRFAAASIDSLVSARPGQPDAVG